MNKLCKQCNSEQGVTNCDKCGLITCTDCCTIVPKPNGEVEIKHSSCVRKRKEMIE